MTTEPQGRVSRETRVGAVERFCGSLGIVPTQADGLVTLADLLAGVAVARGFIAPGDADRVLERHVLDGLRAAPLLEGSTRVGDAGSGAGIPGLPLALVLPDVHFDLIEPRQARVAFLESAVDRLALGNVSVVHGRVEGVPNASYDAALARAFAPLERAWTTIRPKLRDGGRLVFFGGESAEVPDGLPDASAIVRHAADPATAAVLERSGPLIIITAQ